MGRENVPFEEHPSQVCVKFRQQQLGHQKQPIMKQLDCCQKIKRNTLYPMFNVITTNIMNWKNNLPLQITIA